MNKKNIYYVNKKFITFTIAGLTLTLILFDSSNNYLNNVETQEVDIPKTEETISLIDKNYISKYLVKENNIYDNKYLENKTYLLNNNKVEFLENKKLILSNKEGTILEGNYEIKFNTLFINIKKKFNNFDFSIHNLNINNNEIKGKLNNKENITLQMLN